MEEFYQAGSVSVTSKEVCGLSKSQNRVCVVGLWHLGCVYASCLAKLGYDVIGADEDAGIINDLRMGKPPVFEPGLADLIAEGMAKGNLTFTGQVERGAENTSYVIIAHDTPLNASDDVDLTIIFRTAQQLKEIRDATFVVSSQVPVGTCQRIESILAEENVRPSLAYVPENLKLGQAVERFMKPEMLVIGANSPSAISATRALFKSIQTRIFEMDLRSAEMTKHALNAFLSTSISFANEIGNLCDLVGADALKVAEALRSDSRIGPEALLRPGLGFSGGTLARDLRVLQRTGEKYCYETQLFNAVLSVNQRQNLSIVTRLRQILGTIQGRSICVLGLTYKSGTSTLRRSVALDVIEQLTREGAAVNAFDPQVNRLDPTLRVSLYSDVYAACTESDAAIILNDWPQFADLDFNKIRKLMKTPIIFDAQNLLDPASMNECGIRYIGIGRGTSQIAAQEGTR